MLKPKDCLGEVDAQTLPGSAVEETEEARRIRLAQAEKPPLAAIINMNDFEVLNRASFMHLSRLFNEPCIYRLLQSHF